MPPVPTRYRPRRASCTHEGCGPRAAFQPEIVPLRFAKRNEALVRSDSTKFAVLLKTCPVGPFGGLPTGVVTTSAWGVPLVL